MFVLCNNSDCQEFKRDDGSTACYKVASEGSSYHEAMEACISEGFTLAEIQGPLDQANLMAMAQPFKVINTRALNKDLQCNRHFSSIQNISKCG